MSLPGISDVHARLHARRHSRVSVVCSYPLCLMIMCVLFSPFQGRTTKSLSLGGAHACAILHNDTVKCWGYNGQGQLGLGDNINRGSSSGEMGDDLDTVDLGPVSGAAAPWQE